MKSVVQEQLDARAFFAKVWSDGAPIVTASAKAVIEVIAIRMYFAGIKSQIEQTRETRECAHAWLHPGTSPRATVCVKCGEPASKKNGGHA